MTPYYAFRWWVKWFAPLPLLIWISKTQMGGIHVWYQDEDINIEVIPRGTR